jgi:hypothetical protein
MIASHHSSYRLSILYILFMRICDIPELPRRNHDKEQRNPKDKIHHRRHKFSGNSSYHRPMNPKYNSKDIQDHSHPPVSRVLTTHILHLLRLLHNLSGLLYHFLPSLTMPIYSTLAQFHSRNIR